VSKLIDPIIRMKIVGLHYSGFADAHISDALAVKREQVKYVVNCAVGSRKPVPYVRERKCARCGRIDIVRKDHKAVHCRRCGIDVQAASKRRSHADRWTTANCRQCGSVFHILKCNLESRRRGHSQNPRPNFVPFCSRSCYADWQRDPRKKRGQRKRFA
jgi:hypothetical protein